MNCNPVEFINFRLFKPFSDSVLLGLSPQAFALKYNLNLQPPAMDSSKSKEESDQSTTISAQSNAKTTVEELLELKSNSNSFKSPIILPEFSDSKRIATSQYEDNFEELELLGQGSSGEVVKVR